jgi:hypothetical protein
MMMDQGQLQDAAPQHPDPVSGTGRHVVTITVDGEAKEVPAGKYVVSQFKRLLGVPADYELDEVVHGEFRPLADEATIEVKEHDVFVSHVRRGGSS